MTVCNCFVEKYVLLQLLHVTDHRMLSRITQPFALIPVSKHPNLPPYPISLLLPLQYRGAQVSASEIHILSLMRSFHAAQGLSGS